MFDGKYGPVVSVECSVDGRITMLNATLGGFHVVKLYLI